MFGIRRWRRWIFRGISAGKGKCFNKWKWKEGGRDGVLASVTAVENCFHDADEHVLDKDLVAQVSNYNSQLTSFK